MKTLLISLCLFSIHQLALGAEPYLETPKGEYGVGVKEFRVVQGHLKKGAYICDKPDLFYVPGKNDSAFGKDNQQNFCRENMVRIYYPAPNRHPLDQYYSDAELKELQNSIKAANISQISESDLNALANIKSFAVNDAPIADKRHKKFPTLVFVPGTGAYVHLYENLITHIVSHGYIVVGVNNTFVSDATAFPDGRIVDIGMDPTKVQDIANADRSVFNDILFVRRHLEKHAFSKLAAHMDLDRIGLFGHSIGAISVVRAARKSEPDLFRAAIALDAPPVGFGTRTFSKKELAGSRHVPLFRILAADWRNLGGAIVTPKDAEFELCKNNFFAVLSPNEKNTTYTGHMSYADLSTLQYQAAWNLFLKQDDYTGLGTADGFKVTRDLNAYIVAFFDQYLKKIPSANLNRCVPISDDSFMKCFAKH